jgi:signal transduction histidine kinase
LDSLLFWLEPVLIISLVGFALVIILFYKRRIAELEKQARDERNYFFRSAMQIVDFDRDRISKNIHDEIGSNLSIIKLNLSTMVKEGPGEHSARLAQNSLELISETIRHTRDISKDLAPQSLIRFGYESGLAELCNQISASNKINISIKRSKEEKRMIPVVELQLYRVVQEVLNNIIKHADASEILLTILSGSSPMTEIRHNGNGISQDEADMLLKSSEGMGMKSIQMRLQMLNASIHYEKEKMFSRITIRVKEQ